MRSRSRNRPSSQRREFSIKLGTILNELPCQKKLIGSAMHHDRILALHAVELGVGQHVSEGGLNVIQIILLR